MRLFVLLLFLSFLPSKGQTLSKKTFLLPEIKKLTYLAIPSSLEGIFPTSSCHGNLINLLKSYNKKLDNIGEYEVYLVRQSCTFSQNTCLCFETTAQGEFNFLLLYKRKSKMAKVFIASYDFLSDSEVYMMNFKIHKNEVQLTDTGFTEGDSGKAEVFTKNNLKVTVLKSGEVKVTVARE